MLKKRFVRFLKNCVESGKEKGFSFCMILREPFIQYKVVAKGLDKDSVLCDSAEHTVELARRYWAEKLSPDVESCVVISLNRKGRAISIKVVSSGTATACLVDARLVYRTAIVENAAAVVLLHNHPSGDPSPSAGDTNITRNIREASKFLGIDFVDHIILGEKECDPTGLGFYSYRQSGIL